MEKLPKEHIGMESPMKELRKEIQKLAQEADRMEENIEKTKKTGNKKTIEELKRKHEQLMTEQREKLQRVKHLKELKLKE